MENKDRVMKKAQLHNERNLKDVFIGHDKSKQQRMYEADLRTIVETVGKDRRVNVREDTRQAYDSQDNHGKDRDNLDDTNKEKRAVSHDNADPTNPHRT